MLPRNQMYYRPFQPSTFTKAVSFTPYQSDSESEYSSDEDESGSVTSTQSSSSEENQPNFAEFASNMQLASAAGPNLTNFMSQTDFGVDNMKANVGYASIARAFNINLPFNDGNFDLSGTDIFKADAPPTQAVTSIIMLNSRDRDRNVFPQPTQLTLRLPRVYNNITSLQVVQMKLLSSFLYFRPDKGNLSLLINEFGSVKYDYLGVQSGQLNILTNIRSGTYNINTLINELTTQLNTPPIFYDYPGGFNQFIPLFTSTGDFSINFNYPGDYFYDSLNAVFTAAPTRDFITTRYWQSPTLGFTPTLKQSKVAYYYPILKEYVIDPDYGLGKLNTAIDLSGLLDKETIYSRVVYAFQGVNDLVIQELINLNATELDIYRTAHSFRNSLINKYNVNYDSFNNRIFFQSPSLNTSLVNLLNSQYAIFFQQQLSAYGITSNVYSGLQTTNSQILSIINAMYDYIQRQLAIYFGINFNTFAPVYFTQANNYINIQSALNAIGVSSNYDLAVVTSGRDATTSNVVELNRRDPIAYWPNMSNLPTDPVLGTLGYPINLGASNVSPYLGASNYAYDIATNDFNFNQPFIDAAGNVEIDLRRKAGDILCPIQAGKYTVFKFRSLYRQTLQVETLPRPTQYRYPAYNPGNFNSNIANFFDNSYSYVFNSNNARMDTVTYSNLYRIPGFSNDNVAQATDFGLSYSDSLTLWGSNYLSIDVRNSLYNYVFFLPFPQNPLVTGPAYKNRMALTLLNNTSNAPIPSAMEIFLYHDRAGFMADLSGNARNENIYHYKTKQTINSGDISGSLIWNAYAGQTYYAVLRSQNISFQSFQAKFLLWYPDGSNFSTLTNSIDAPFNPFSDPTSNLNNFNYAQVADPDFIRLPIASNLWPVNPSGNEVNLGLSISNVPIGYDTNGVSTDLTDYVGYTPNITSNNILPSALIRVDPISGYFFQVGSPYSQANQSYLYTGANNFILTPTNQSNYTPQTVANRQYKIVHWYDTTYIPDPAESIITYNSGTDLTPYLTPYTVATTCNVPLSNYKYDLSNNNIQLGLGCCGFTFAPTDGTWSVERLMFRSAFINNDLNSNIQYLGIFLTSFANTTPSYLLSLNDAVAKLDLNSNRTKRYRSAADVNFGFDPVLGTYYEFIADSNFAQQELSGFAQNAEIFFNNPNNFYSVIPFDANSNIAYMKALTGSVVPYPVVCDPSASRFYFDGNAAPTRTGIVMPKPPNIPNSPYGPPTGISYSLSAYEQSIPIGTNVLHYLSQTDLAQDVSGFNAWKGIPYAPTQLFADISGRMMIQGTDFKIYTYPYNSNNRTFTPEFSLTVDDIYPGSESTILVAAGANSTVYAFLGFQVVGVSYQVRIKVYDPALGQLFDIFVPSQFQIPDLGFSVKNFCFNDQQGFVIAGSSSAGIAVTYRTPSLNTVGFFVDTYPGFRTVKALQVPSRTTIYSQVYDVSGNAPMYFYGVNASQSYSLINTYTINPGDSIPSTFNNFTTTYYPGKGDELIFLSASYPSYFFKAQTILGTAPSYTVTLQISIYQFRLLNGNLTTPINIIGGAEGGVWTLLSQSPYILGNRNDGSDAPIKIQNAWQMFYPNAKIVLRKLNNAQNPITDLSGLQYPEFPHTAMFVYNTKAAYNADISNSISPRWGLESSGGLLPNNLYNLNSNGFLVSDPKMTGYQFNSYIFNVPLLPNQGGNPESHYYLAVRSYAPSEKSQVLLRFNMPQRYDFGFVRIRDLSNEPVFAASNTALFNPTYYTALSQFNSNFVLSNVNFGYNPSQNINGKNITSTGFGDFVNQYVTLYNQYTSNVNLITNITNNVNANMLTFINTNLTYALPNYAKTRQAFTDPVTFSILFRTALTPTYLFAEDEWGLGWNLGFEKRDTPYATIQRADSFFKILDDYIYLKLNPEYNMNRMDFGAKENLAETTEPQGTIRGYNGKLLLNTFGNFAQTIIQNPVYFTGAPLLKLDKLSFTWFDVNNNVLDNAECEWNAAIQIVEEMLVPAIKGKNPVVIPR